MEPSDGAGGTTAKRVVREAYAESPLRLLTPRNHGSSAWAYTSTLGGGFVDGDRVRLRIAVGEGARAFVSTQGPTRIYRSPRGCESETAAVKPGKPDESLLIKAIRYTDENLQMPPRGRLPAAAIADSRRELYVARVSYQHRLV